MFISPLTLIQTLFFVMAGRFLDPDPQQLVEELKANTTKRFRKLNEALAQLVSGKLDVEEVTIVFHWIKRQHSY